jgi:hypothetical protein
MEEIGVFEFSLIRDHSDYIEFSIIYCLGNKICKVGGMGWVGQELANYYLKDLLLNKKPASTPDINKAGVMLDGYSMKFHCPELDRLALSKIRQHWKKLHLRLK